MAAQFDLVRRREPAQVEVRLAVVAGTVKAVSLEIILGGDRLHQRVVEPRSSGITAAGLPVSGRSANASTWKKGMLVTGSLGDFLRQQGLPVGLPLGVDVDQDLGVREALLQLLLDPVEPVVRFLHRPIRRDPHVELAK